MRKKSIRSKMAMLMACTMLMMAVPSNVMMAAGPETVSKTEMSEEKAERLKQEKKKKEAEKQKRQEKLSKQEKEARKKKSKTAERPVVVTEAPEKEGSAAAPVRKERTAYDEEIVKIELIKGLEKIDFFERYDIDYYVYNMQIKITYTNGDVSEGDVDEYYDSEEIIGYEYYAKGDMETPVDSWDLSAGDYVVRLYAYFGDAYVDCPFTVLSVAEAAKVTLKEDVVSTFAEDEDRAVFQYTPDRSGKHVFCVKPMSYEFDIYNQEMVRLRTKTNLNGTGYCVELEQGKTYYGVFEKEKGAKLKVTVSSSGELEGITVRTRKTQFIAGMEYLTSGAIEVDTHYQDKQKRLIAGDSEDQYGNKAKYTLMKDGEQYSMGRPLEIGTYQLTASVVGKPELTDTIEVEATGVDMDQLQLIPENQEVTVQRNNFVQLCSFVPEKDEVYFAEIERGGCIEKFPLMFYIQTEKGLAGGKGALNKGERYVFQVPFDLYENKVKLCIKNDTETSKGEELELDKTKEVVVTEEGNILYTFTPKETGYYALESIMDGDSSSCDLWVELYEDGKYLCYDDGEEGRQFFLCKKLEAGHTYTYKVGSYSAYAKFHILLQKIEISQEGELELDKTEEVVVTEEGNISYTFTPKETGYYALESSAINGGSSSCDPWVELYEDGDYLDSDDDGGEGFQFFLKKELEAGHTYTYEVGSYSKYMKFHILLQKIEISQGGELELDKTEEVVVTKEGNISYTFTPKETGYYALESSAINGDSSSCDPWVELYEDEEYLGSDDDGGEGEQFFLRKELEAGHTYTYYIECYSSFSRFNMVLQKDDPKKPAYPEIIMDDKEYIEHSEELDELSCAIQLYYEDGTSVGENMWEIFYYLDDESVYEDRYGNEYTLLMELLNETDTIKTYQLKVTFGGVTKTQKLVVKKLAGLAQDVLKENGSLTYRASGGEHFSVFKFVPSTDGEYIFNITQDATDGDLDYYLEYISDSWSWWHSCDDYGDGKYITRNLEKGQTYYFAVYEPEDYVGSYTLTGSRRKEVDGVELITNRTAMTPYEFFDWTFSDDFKANVHYTDGTSAVVEMNSQDAYVNNVSLGCNKINQNQLEFTGWCKDLREYRNYWDSKILTVDLNHLPEAVVDQKITSLNGGEYKEVYQITPEKSGTYSMIFDCAHYEVGLYNADFQDLLSCADGWYLEKGKKYYLKIRMDNNGKQSSCVLTKEMHTMGQWVTVKKETCTMDGLCTRKCVDEGCEYSETKIIPKTGHKYGSYQVTKEPAVLEEGVKTRICSACGYKDTAAIAKLPATISVNAKSIVLQVKQSTTALKVTCGKGDAVASWKSGNNKIAAVNQKGKIIGKKVGKATITATLKSGKSVRIKVKVQKQKVKTKKLKLNKKSLTLKKGQSFNLLASAAPITTQEKITYKSSNKKVVSVTSKGTIKARRKGKTYIIVKSGSKSVKCKVIVK